jgi:hypothetical protein
MTATITPAPEVQQIADELIPQYHPHLEDALLLYVFTDQQRTRNGKQVLGTASKLSAKERYLLQAAAPLHPQDLPDLRPAFLLMFAGALWPQLTEAQRVALVDHELMHCGADGALVPHDVEEFAAIIQRHGLWTPDVQAFAVAVQERLFEPEVS